MHIPLKYLVCLFLLCLCGFTEGKTVFRRADKISENFKQLELTPDEIDPNVAPPNTNNVQSTPVDSVESDTTAASSTDEIIDEANEVTNEIENAEDEATDAAVTPAAAAAPAATPAAVETTTPVKQENEGLSKYCKCTESHCDCCRNFGLPLIPVRGPGCAKITYLGNEKMSVSIKYGDITLATRTISGNFFKQQLISMT